MFNNFRVIQLLKAKVNNMYSTINVLTSTMYTINNEVTCFGYKTTAIIMPELQDTKMGFLKL